MGLRIRLKPHEKLIINGCVVENGDRRNTITVSSFGQVLKSRDIMKPEEARAPVQKLYYEIQALLIEAPHSYERVSKVNALAAGILNDRSALEAETAILRAMDYVHAQDPYRALSALRPHAFPPASGGFGPGVCAA